MIRTIRNTALLALPFMVMIMVNEIVRFTQKDGPYSQHGVATINSGEEVPDKCTWICHNNTNYCKENHVTVLKPYLPVTDVFYFGIISLLQLTGSYGMANIIVLVVFMPFWIWYFTIRSLNIQDKINKLNAQR